MIQINNINFSQKTIESIQIDGGDVKGIEVELHNNNFKLTIIKNTNVTIKEEINDILYSLRTRTRRTKRRRTKRRRTRRRTRTKRRRRT